MKGFIIFAAVMLVAACGGGGGSTPVEPSGTAAGSTGSTGSTDNTSEPITFEGKVIDGYISGATVCLDINNNFLCDPDEPSALSGAGGTYEFTYEGTVPAGTQILADIPIGAVDEDLGPIEKAYNMMAPSDNPSVVTPLTTMVSQEIIGSGGELSSEDAETAVKVSLGMSKTTNLLENDFIESEETALQEVAEVVAVALQVTKETLEDSDGAADLTPAELTKAAMSTVKASVAALVVNGEAAVTKEQAATVTSTTVAGQVQNIVTATKSGDGEVVNLLDVLTAGEIAIVSEGDFAALDENKNGVWDEAEEPLDFYDYLTLELLYFPEAKEGTLVDLDTDLKIGMYIDDSSEWLRTFNPYDGSDKDLVNDVWTNQSESESGAKIDKNCATFYNSDTPTESYCFVRKDLSGFTVDEAIPGICENDDGTTVAGCDVNAELPEGSYVYDLTLSTADNKYGGSYVLFGGDWSGYVGDGGDQTIDGFIAAHTNLNTSYIGNNCNTAFRVSSYDAELGTGVMQWGDNSGPGECDGSFDFEAAGETSLEETAFEVVTFGETKIFKTVKPKLYRANNQDEESPYLIFGETTNTGGDNVVFQGRFTPSNTKISLPFTGDPENTVFASRVAIDFIFEQAGISPFPYELFIED